MTISSASRLAGPFTGTGSAVDFPFSFKVFSSADLRVVRCDDATEVETALVPSSDYTVSLNDDQNANPGGTVTLTTALAAGQTLVITSDIAALQTTDLQNQGGFYPEVIETALDRIVVLVQQLEEEIGRAITTRITGGETAEDLLSEIQTVAATAAGYLAEYRDRWFGVAASDPTNDLNGGALTGGELYFNSVTQRMRVYTGGGWSDTGVEVNIAYLAALAAADPQHAYDVDGDEAVYPVVTDSAYRAYGP